MNKFWQHIFLCDNLIFIMPKSKDENVLAKSVIDDIIDWTESDDFIESDESKIARKGGKARAAKLTSAERSAIAKKAAQKRWNKNAN